MFRSLFYLASLVVLVTGASVRAEADYLEGKWTVSVHLSQPTGDARLGSLTESTLVIGAKVSPPKQTREDWLEDLPTFRGKWKPYPLAGDKSPIIPMGSGFQITAMGGDLWGKSDKCNQLLTPIVGDFSITCQVTWTKADHEWAKAGIIFRTGTEENSPCVAVLNSFKKDCVLCVRDKPGVDMQNRGGGQGGPGVLMRFERQGDSFRSSFTVNGRNWNSKSTSLKLSPSGYIGFAVCSNDPKAKATATFAITQAKGMVTEEGNLVMFDKDDYSVVESGKTVSLTARRVGDGKGVLKVPWMAKSGTAAAGSDFMGESGEVVWNDSEPGIKKFNIAIVNNPKPEPAKIFSVELGKPTEGTASLGSRQARVTILDDDGGGVIRFQNMVTCAENSKTPMAMINVLREQGKKGAVQVSYTTRAGSAKAGEKYKDVSGTLSWADGDDKPKTIQVPILWPELVAANTDDLLSAGANKKPAEKKAEAKKAEEAKKAANEEE